MPNWLLARSPVDKVLAFPVLVCNYTPQHDIGRTHHIPGDNEGIYPPNQHLPASSMFNRPSPSTISITLRAQIKGKIHLLRYLDNIYTLSNYGLLFIMPRWWLRLIPGLIIIYYVRVQACLTQWKSDIFLLIINLLNSLPNAMAV